MARLREPRIVAVVAILLIVSACSSAPPDRIVYNSLDGAVEGVQTAMRAFNDVYQAGKATEAQRGQVLAAYAKFQVAAAAAAKIAPGATAPNADLLKVALDSAADIVTMIRGLTGK